MHYFKILFPGHSLLKHFFKGEFMHAGQIGSEVLNVIDCISHSSLCLSSPKISLYAQADVKDQ